ncbi:MAG: TVP38/TMEM64 family protein [Planctomycetaceae bacterium]
MLTVGRQSESVNQNALPISPHWREAVPIVAIDRHRWANPRIDSLIEDLIPNTAPSPIGQPLTSMDDLSTSSVNFSQRWRLIVAVALVVGIAAVVTVYRDELKLSNLVQYEDWLRQTQAERPVVVFLTAFAVFVVVTSLSLPVATGLTLFCGWYFPFWQAALLVSFASTTGATLAFWISRYLLRASVQLRFGDRLARFNEELERDGPIYLFTLRLLPVIPFFVINSVMGLTPIRTRTFWWVSQLGLLPVNFVWVAVGATAPSLRVLAEQGLAGLPILPITIAFALLGLFLLAIKKLL